MIDCIVWDPREPLPADIGGQPHVAYHVHILPDEPTIKVLPDNILQEPTRNLLSPLSVSINGRIVDDAARVTVSQVFWNNADIPIPKASYVFPLPSGCTVTSFSCRIGRDKTMRAKVKPKAKARQAFHQAVAAQRTAALLEQNTPELFTASLGNIPTDTRLEAELTYVTLLKRQFSQEKNITEFTIPTAIASRYGSAPSDIQVNVSGATPNSFTLQLEVMEAEKIIQIKSDTHKVLLDEALSKRKVSNWANLLRKSQESRIDVATVELDSSVGVLHEDFILTIETNSPSKVDDAHAWLESHPTLDNQKAMMVTIPSSLMLESKETAKEGEVLFLIDRSGSMQDKIEAVKSSLRFFLKGIPIDRKFNIWSFGSSYKQLWDKSRHYTSKSLQLALDHVKELKSDMGGTELLPALAAMIASRDKSCPCDMIILTDGEVWRLNETLTLVQTTKASSQGAVRFFSLGIGAHVSHALVQGIASHGGGYSEVIPKASTGGWEDRVVSMLKAALTTHVSTMGIKLNGKDDYDRFLASPADFRDLNPFQGNRVYFLSKPDSPLDKLGSVVIETVKSNGDRESTTIPVTALKQRDNIIHNLGVQAIVEDVGNPKKQILSPTQATELACRFSLVSKWTSFFLEQEIPKPKYGDNEIPLRDAADNLDDLLQPRGMIQDSTSESISQIKRGYSGVNTANLDCKFNSYPYDPLTEGGYLGLVEDLGCVSDDSFEMGFLLEAGSPLGNNGGKKKVAETQPSKTTSDPHREFVTKLLSYQNFNGSFNPGTKSILGSSLAQAAQDIEKHALKNKIVQDAETAGFLTYTVVAAVLLERDLQDCKDLWDLMVAKASRYVSDLVSDESRRNKFYDFVKQQLAGKALSMEDGKTSPTDQTTAAIEDPDVQQPERTAVKVAPLD
ncbi:von Willebrand factor type A domain-containing protein [Rostrohypoxylon terebratum]|nr:von Willebrand factor type A domain-containing protein [Rostrohypoxylon terebratum]